MTSASLDMGDLWRRLSPAYRQWFKEHASLRWVPAHDRHPDWTPASPFASLTLRHLNAAADRACAQTMQRMRVRDVQRRHWLQEVLCAERWAQLVLERATACQHHMRLRYSPSELPCLLGVDLSGAESTLHV